MAYASFDRLGRHVALTEAGRGCSTMPIRCSAWPTKPRWRSPTCANQSGQLIIAAPETLSGYRLPPLLKQFRAQFPRVQLILRSLSVGEALAQLSDGRVDVAVLLTDPPPAASGIIVCR